MKERVSPSPRRVWMALPIALCLWAASCTSGAPARGGADVDLTPSTAAKPDGGADAGDAASVDAGRSTVDPTKADAAIKNLDAGDASRPRDEMTDASGRDDAQVRGDGAVELDFCGQMLPAHPSASGVLANSVLFYPPLAQHPDVAARGPAISGSFGARVMWIFGETRARANAAVVAENAYTLSSFDRRYELGEAAPDAPEPISFIPAQLDDLALLADGETLHYEPGSLISVGPTESLLFYSPARRVPTDDGFRDERIGTRVVRVKTDLSTIFVEPLPELLFPASAPSMRFGMTGRDGNVYLYGCAQNADGQYDCLLARAPAGAANVARGYQYRTTGGWSNDPRSAVPVLQNAHSELSVSYNAYLRRYLAVFLIGGSNEIALHTAERPEGPFTRLDTLRVPRDARTDGELGVALEHPELAGKCGRHLTLTYLDPLDDGSVEVRPVEFDLR